MDRNMYVLSLILVSAAVTLIIRALPFLVFGKKTPAVITYLGSVLPYAVMAMLLVYCMKAVSFAWVGSWLPEAISVLAVVVIHKLYHNTLLSIIVGTVLYMVLVQRVFV